MAIDADGNFYNPYSPGSYEYEMEEGTRGQEPGTGGVVTVAQTPDILRVQQAAPPPGFNTFNQITGLILSVATLSVPLLGEMIGASILEGLGVTGATAAVEAGVGAAALSAGSTAAQGGSVEDVLKSAATAGFASGINVGMGGGVAGAATGSFVGSAIQGGGVDQVLTNALAAGAGAGVQGVLGPAAGTIVRDLIKTGEVSDQTLIKAAISEVGAWNKAGDRKAPIVEGQPIVPPAAEEPAPTSITLEPKEETPAAVPAETLAPAAPPTGPVFETKTIAETSPIVSPTVTDLDLVKQVAAQPTPAVDPKTLQQVIVQGQGANVAPVETTVPSTTVPSTATVATPTPAQPFPTPTITPVAEPEKEAPVVTDVPQAQPPQTEFEKKFISETVPAPVSTGPEFQQVTIRETVPPPVDATEFEQKTIRETVPRASDVVTETPAPPAAAPPAAAPPTELEKVTVTAKRDEEPAPTITDIVAKTMEPPPAPPPPAAPEVKAEEPKKEEPKKEAKKLYPTVTSVPPPKRPGRQPIITGASPARLLADALAAYRPAGAIEGEESGKERQNVWNEKSLRLKDALGL
jgi:hypothetical protein